MQTDGSTINDGDSNGGTSFSLPRAQSAAPHKACPPHSCDPPKKKQQQGNRNINSGTPYTSKKQPQHIFRRRRQTCMHRSIVPRCSLLVLVFLHTPRSFHVGAPTPRLWLPFGVVRALNMLHIRHGLAGLFPRWRKNKFSSFLIFWTMACYIIKPLLYDLTLVPPLKSPIDKHILIHPSIRQPIAFESLDSPALARLPLGFEVYVVLLLVALLH